MIWMERRQSERMDEGKEGRERREGKTLIKKDVIREIAATGCVLEYDLFGQEVHESLLYLSLLSSPSPPSPSPSILLLSSYSSLPRSHTTHTRATSRVCRTIHNESNGSSV